MPNSVASDMCRHYLPMSNLRAARHIWVKEYLMIVLGKLSQFLDKNMLWVLIRLSHNEYPYHNMFLWLVGLESNDPVNTIKLMLSWSVYLTTLL